MARNKGYLLFDVTTEINPITGRPSETQITNWSIGTVKSFSNLGTQSQSAAGIPFTIITDKVKITSTKYKLQRNLLLKNTKNEWKLWTVLKPEDLVPRNANLINLVLQENDNESILALAKTFYDNNKGGA